MLLLKVVLLFLVAFIGIKRGSPINLDIDVDGVDDQKN